MNTLLSSKLKELSNEKLNVDDMIDSVSEKFENIVGKGEIDGS